MPLQPEYADPQRYAELAGFRGSWRDLWWNRDFLDLIGRRFELGNIRHALDVGCGAGHWGRVVLPLLADEARLTGVDREEAFLTLARESLDPERSEYLVGSVERLPFDDDTFELVTCQTLLIHVADPELAIREMMRVLAPGGLLLAAEPDNRAGNIALLGGEPRVSDEDILAILTLLLRGERGKALLGEGDQSIGGRLPGLFAAGGLTEVVAYNNDRCHTFYPPYERGDMQIGIEQELQWARQDVSLLCGARADNWRLFQAAGGSEEEFTHCWEAVRRWMTAFRLGVERGDYHAARGFVMYLVAGRKPTA